MASFKTYHILESGGIAAWLASNPVLSARLGGSLSAWKISEVSDGNMNRVFIVTGSAGSVAVKQALPYIRAVPDWAFPADRIDYEARAIRAFAFAAPGAVPELLRHDPVMKVMAMEALDRHRVWRGALVEGVVHEDAPAQLARDLAAIHHCGSMEALGAQGFRESMAAYGTNPQLVSTTAEVIFTGPFGDHPLNNWTSPQLDAQVATVRADTQLKAALSRLKLHFLGTTETLIHGDLHTGSVMVASDPKEQLQPRIIDAEWAFHGPAAFDVGALIGNLLLAACAQPGHEKQPGERAATAEFCWKAADLFWKTYCEQRLTLWGDPEEDAVLPHRFEPDASARKALRTIRLARIWPAALGFAGAKMLRRLIGISHVEDFTTIPDENRRARCETHALRLARLLVLQAHQFDDISRIRGFHDQSGEVA